MAIEVRRFVMEHVSDASGITRILADQAFRGILAEHGSGNPDAVPMVWSCGCDGVIFPHATVFARAADGGPTGQTRLSMGIAWSDMILPEDIGRPAMVEKVADGVKQAVANAGITDPAEVHYVQTKTPLLTMESVNDTKSRGQTVFSEDIHQSMDMSNGTTGLGIAVALDEIPMPPRRLRRRGPRVVTTGMAVAAVLGLLLVSLIPGTRRERGLELPGARAQTEISEVENP